MSSIPTAPGHNKHRASPEAIAAAADPDALISIKVVCALTGLSPTTIWLWAREGRFPKPLHINRRVTRWRAGDVRAWLQAQGAPDPLRLPG